MNKNILEEVVEVLRTRDNFLIAAHINPEGDSIGSQLSIFYLLEKLGKKAVMAGHYSVPDNLKFLPGVKSILRELPGDFRPETAIVLDCPTKDRVGKIARYLDEVQLVVNIDHHVSNEFFGNINWVEPESSSVGEMIYGIVKKLEIKLDYGITAPLYVAIITDTGMFNYDNTSKRTHEIVGELIESGINPGVMHGKIYENKPLSQIKVLSRALATVKLEENGRVASMCLTRDMYKAEGVKSVSTEEFINYPRSIKGVEVTVFFKESVKKADVVDVSFRSAERIDVDSIASRFGGGGHKRAAGCVVRGNLEEAKYRVLAEVKKALEEKL